MTDAVLITGCSSGIGLSTARRFLDDGWRVYATARDSDDTAGLDERGCETFELDVTDEQQVAAVVDGIFEETGRLDCLVNNAGYGQFGPVEDVPMEAVAQQFDVNTLGPLRLIRAALPRMRERGRGTIINVTAGFGDLSMPGIGVYTASKYALESATIALRQEVSQFGVDTVYVEPGVVATSFYDRALSELDDLDRTPAYDDLYRALDSIGVVRGGGPGINRPERVAAVIHRAATANDPDPAYRVGPVASLGTYAGRVLRGDLRDGASRVGLRTLSSAPAQRWLSRRERRIGETEPPTSER